MSDDEEFGELLGELDIEEEDIQEEPEEEENISEKISYKDISRVQHEDVGVQILTGRLGETQKKLITPEQNFATILYQTILSLGLENSPIGRDVQNKAKQYNVNSSPKMLVFAILFTLSYKKETTKENISQFVKKYKLEKTKFDLYRYIKFIQNKS
jgi:hypothetical protein